MDPNILGLKGQGFLIRFLHYTKQTLIAALHFVGGRAAEHRAELQESAVKS